MRGALRSCLAGLAWTLLAAQAAAQSTAASVSGTVFDAQRAIVPGAAILLKNLDTSASRDTSTDRSGRFQVIGLTPGRYELRARKAGFAEFLLPALTLAIATDAEVPITLQIASITGEVTVQADASALGAPTMIGRTFSSREIDDLPVTARDFVNLALLTPGILLDRGTGRNPTPAIVAAGQTPRNNTVLTDGLSLDEHFSGQPRAGLSLDAVKEFVVQPTSFGVEHGQASGAVVSVLTRSGTNRLMGRAFYYRRDDRLNATNAAVRLVDPPGEKDRIGGDTGGGFLGGPLQRDHAFYLISIERTARNTESIITAPLLKVFRPDAPTRVPVRFRDPQVLGRVDLNLSPRSTLTARARFDKVTETNQTSDPGPEALVAPERRLDATRRDREVAVLANQILGVTAFNELRAQFAQYVVDTANDDVRRFCSGCPAFNYSGLLLGQSPTAPAHRTETRSQFADTLTWLAPDAFGSHTLKIGTDISVIGVASHASNGFNGIWRFGPDAKQPFDAATPATYPGRMTLFYGDPNSRDRHQLYAVFVEDTWKPFAGVTLRLGARWDYEHAAGIASDRDNVAPRIGVAFDPTRQGRTVFRGGFGVYYDAVLARALSNSQTEERGTYSIEITNPAFDPTVLNPFVEPHRSGYRVSARSVNRMASNLRTPYTQQASLGVRHTAGLFAITADGVWAQGHNLLRTRDLNYPDLSDPQLRRPDPNFARIRVREAEGHSWYRALLFGLQKMHADRYSYGVAYTLSRSERDTEDWEFVPNDQRNYDAERGPASTDVRHRFVANVNIDLPVGLRVGAILAAQSAPPYNVTVGSDQNRDGEAGPDRPADVPGRNSARGDNFRQLDLRLSKTFHVNTSRLELLLEAFNITNHTNWVDYDGDRSSLTFGQPTSAAMAREIQIGIKIGF